MTDLEDDFRRLIESLREEHGPDLQPILKEMGVDDVQPEFQMCFLFWKSLSGRSRNLMIDNAQGRRQRKRF